MKVRLTKKLAHMIDGIDLGEHTVGETLDLPPRHASLLLAEEWAAPERRLRTESITNGRRADDLARAISRVG